MIQMVGNFITGEEEAWGSIDMVLQKDEKNAMDELSEQRGDFNLNQNKIETFTYD